MDTRSVYAWVRCGFISYRPSRSFGIAGASLHIEAGANLPQESPALTASFLCYFYAGQSK